MGKLMILCNCKSWIWELLRHSVLQEGSVLPGVVFPSPTRCSFFPHDMGAALCLQASLAQGSRSGSIKRRFAMCKRGLDNAPRVGSLGVLFGAMSCVG